MTDLREPRLTEQIVWGVLHEFGHDKWPAFGSFGQAITKAAIAADQENLRALTNAFPAIAMAVAIYKDADRGPEYLMAIGRGEPTTIQFTFPVDHIFGLSRSFPWIVSRDQVSGG